MTLAPSLCVNAMIGPIMENLPQLSNVFCIMVLCSAVIIYKKVIELLASTCATQVARGKWNRIRDSVSWMLKQITVSYSLCS